MRIRALSIPGERHERIEDFYTLRYGAGQLMVAVGDWANNHLGRSYQDKEIADFLGEPDYFNGGVIGAAIVQKTIELTDLTGMALINKINAELRKKYSELGIEAYQENRGLCFTGYIAQVVAGRDKTIITSVGDVRVAADGKIVAGKTKAIDEFHAKLRVMYINETGDVSGAYDAVVRPLIVAKQFSYQNTPGHVFSYPAIDGTETKPAVESLTIPTPRSLLIWTDGFETPDEFTLEGLVSKHKEVYEKDPGRCKEYPATGSIKADRTCVEIVF